MAIVISTLVNNSTRSHALQHFNSSIVVDFNLALSSMMMCLVLENTRSNSKLIDDIANMLSAILVSIESLVRCDDHHAMMFLELLSRGSSK